MLSCVGLNEILLWKRDTSGLVLEWKTTYTFLTCTKFLDLSRKFGLDIIPVAVIAWLNLAARICLSRKDDR